MADLRPADVTIQYIATVKSVFDQRHPYFNRTQTKEKCSGCRKRIAISKWQFGSCQQWLVKGHEWFCRQRGFMMLLACSRVGKQGTIRVRLGRAPGAAAARACFRLRRQYVIQVMADCVRSPCNLQKDFLKYFILLRNFGSFNLL